MELRALWRRSNPQEEKGKVNKLLSYRQVSDVLGVKLGTVYSWVSRNRIPHIKLGPRCVRFDAELLQDWVASHRVAPSRSRGER